MGARSRRRKFAGAVNRRSIFRALFDMFTLEVIAGEARGTTFDISANGGAGGMIGRSQSARIPLSDSHLSTEHGQLFREDDLWVYRDLRSTNGSRVLRDGEELVLDG